MEGLKSWSIPFGTLPINHPFILEPLLHFASPQTALQSRDGTTELRAVIDRNRYDELSIKHLIFITIDSVTRIAVRISWNYHARTRPANHPNAGTILRRLAVSDIFAADSRFL